MRKCWRPGLSNDSHWDGLSRSNSRLFACILAAFLAFSGISNPACAQQLAVGFASPNTRDSLTYADAKISLQSFEEINFLAVADRIVCAVAQSGTVKPVIGEVHAKGQLGLSGAENSIVVRAPVSLETMRYIVALLGRYAHQEYVIAFSPGEPRSTAPAELILLRVPASTPRAQSEQVLNRSGVPYRTLLDNHRFLIYLPARTSDSNVRKAAANLGARLRIFHGTGDLFGNDDRNRAVALYDGVIAHYESEHPGTNLSRHLWSQDWRDATSRTCTAR